jgi:plastocyanin
MAAVLALLTAACGDDDGGDSGGAPVKLQGTVNKGATGTVSNGEVEIELDNFYFGPTYTKADAGSTVTVKLENEGDATHTFTIDSLNIDEEVAPGATAEVEVKLPASGAIRYYCRFHAGQGMQGAFYAKDGDTVSD